MYKLIIADDEKIVIDSLKYIIEKNFNNIEIIATARSGREVIEKVDDNVPDIIFMDIRMPGINGLEAIKEIKSRHKHIVIIVLTAFDHFDFAKEALNLGVLEYLLKPVNRTKIVEVINKAVEIVKTEKEKRRMELEMKEKLEYIVPILENGFIYSLTLFDDNSNELLNYKQIFEIEENGGYVMTIEFGDEEKNGGLENKIGYSVRSQNFYPFIRDTINATCRCIVGPVMLNRVVVFVPANYETDEFSSRQKSLAFAEALFQKLSEKLKCSFKIGIGKTCESFELLPSSYEESLKALRYLKSSGVMHYMDIPSRNPQASEYPEHKEKLLLQKVSLGEAVEGANAFNYIFDWLVGKYSNQPLKIKNKLLEILFQLNRMAWEYGTDPESDAISFLEEMLAMNDLSELKLWCKKRIEVIAGQISSYRDYKIGDLTRKAKEYIKANYSKPITLEDISREINVSPQYFSKLFKEETGENFIDYLTGIRIKVAKDLLENSELSIKEICYNIGYSDPNYFSRIFKKIVGVAPTEYKENFSGLN